MTLPPSVSQVELQQLSLTFPTGVQALSDVQLTLGKGEFFALVGPSGCGKSTLLRILAGLQQGYTGEAQLGGQTPAQARAGGRSVGFVFQQPTLLPWRTVLDNVQLPLQLSGRPIDPAEVMALLDRVGLSAFAGSYPHQLSGGMQMRVSVARALITRPSLLLMDEPFAALDELTRQVLHEELLTVWRDQGCTVVFVTHNMFEAVFLAQRVGVMSARPGRLHTLVDVPFEYPRAPELRGDAAFAGKVGEVSRLLRQGAA